MKQVLAQQLWNVFDEEDSVIIDVRTPMEFAISHIPCAKLIPYEEIAQRKEEIPKDKRVFLICRSGSRSGMAQKTLETLGYTNIINVSGGYLNLDTNHKSF